MLLWTTIFLAMALAAAPFALADIVRASTADTAFFVMALFATLSIITAAAATAKRVADHRHHRRR